MRVDLPLDKKTVENQDWAAAGRRAVAGRGPVFSKTLTIVLNIRNNKHIKNKTQTAVINILISFILIMT